MNFLHFKHLPYGLYKLYRPYGLDLYPQQLLCIPVIQLFLCIVIQPQCLQHIYYLFCAHPGKIRAKEHFIGTVFTDDLFHYARAYFRGLSGIKIDLLPRK